MSTLATSRPTSRVRSVLAWSLQGLLALAFLYFGISKLGGGADVVASYEEIGAGQWLRYFTATTEILGGLALLWLPLAGLAAAALAVQMMGAAITQLVVVEDGDAVIPIVFGLLALTIAWLRRDRSIDTLRRLHLLPATR
ncbi:DoxX family protein [Actinoplanes friuliensis]|uniref:DoxX family protein n=1 Tax=Actinoplanes friuliensis DSM 7358 TaxID=1246995 RepID=U5W003_9ACTN|nr:DoxX family protein [Actinoplanes friuliensis]AGZ41241.1 DoxX family protein [Actinoplanes friuliensis DSM 7358]